MIFFTPWPTLSTSTARSPTTRYTSVILPLCFQVRAGNVLSDLLVARYFFTLSVLLNDIYVFSIKVDGEVGEMLDVLSVMMEGVVEVDKEVDEDVYKK